MRISDWSSDVCSSDLVSLPYVPSTHPIYSDAGNTTSLVLGFPIRTSSDHSSVDSSPRLIAASYVLHRLLVPRHPPYALHYLQQRCSRPLCSSQTTHKQPPHADTNKKKILRYDCSSHLSLLPREETRACSLRTQQYVDILFVGFPQR